MCVYVNSRLIHSAMSVLFIWAVLHPPCVQSRPFAHSLLFLVPVMAHFFNNWTVSLDSSVLVIFCSIQAAICWLLSTGTFSGQSFTIGAATSTAQAGFPDHLIKMLGSGCGSVLTISPTLYIRTPVASLVSLSLCLAL